MIEPESVLGGAITPDVNFLEPTLKRAARVWWWFYWRSTLLGALGGVIVVVIVGFIRPVLGASNAIAGWLIFILATIVNSMASIFVFQSLLLKTFAELKIRLLPTEAER